MVNPRRRVTSKGASGLLSRRAPQLIPEPREENRWTALSIFRKMPYDLLTTGNHELYRYPVALANFQRLVRWFGERYVTSNVKVRLPEDGRGERMTMRRRWRKWRTEQGRRVTALGVLFDFKGESFGPSFGCWGCWSKRGKADVFSRSP